MTDGGCVRSACRPIVSPIVRGVVGTSRAPVLFSPSALAPLQYALDGGNAYESTTLDSLQVLRSLESYGTYRKPRTYCCYLADGSDDQMRWTTADVGTYYVTYYNPATATWSSPAALTHNGTAYVFAPTAIRFCSLKVWSTSNPTDAQIQATTLAAAQGSGGLIAWHWCQEESGTTGYNVANTSLNASLVGITQGTFHSTHTGVTFSAANQYGFTLSGSVVVPRNEASPTLDAAGNALQYTGLAPHPAVMETPCITGDGTAVDIALGSQWIPSSADVDMQILYYQSASTTRMGIISQSTFRVAANSSAYTVNTAGSLYVGDSTEGGTIASALTASSWHLIRVYRVSNTVTVECTVLSTGVTKTVSYTETGIAAGNTNLLTASAAIWNDGRVCDFRITTGGVTKYFPLQGGPGSSNTNRDIPWVASDGTYGMVSGGIVNGTVSTIWANRCPGYAQDWCVNYGGKLATNGAFLPGQISGSLAADGNAKTLTAGKHGNPYSRFSPNPWAAPEMRAIGHTTATLYAPGDAQQSVSPADTKFRRTASDGDDRFFSVPAALTGTNKTNAEAYVA